MGNQERIWPCSETFPREGLARILRPALRSGGLDFLATAVLQALIDQGPSAPAFTTWVPPTSTEDPGRWKVSPASA